MSTVDPNQLRDALLFRDLPAEALAALAHHSRRIELGAGEMLFQQGDPGDALYVLVEGQIHIVRAYASGEHVILSTENPYYVVGELSMLASTARSGAVVAVSDSTLIAVTRADFEATCATYPAVAVGVLSYLAQRLYRMTLLVRENAVGNITARLASTVLLLCGNQAAEAPHEVRISRLARAVATDADTVERLLKEWVRLGYIRYDGRRLAIEDFEAVHLIAG